MAKGSVVCGDDDSDGGGGAVICKFCVCVCVYLLEQEMWRCTNLDLKNCGGDDGGGARLYIGRQVGYLLCVCMRECVCACVCMERKNAGWA